MKREITVDEKDVVTLWEDTNQDVKELELWRQGLHDRGERARNLRNDGRVREAEMALSKLLVEAEEMCGEHSHQLSDFLKSLGILYSQQGRMLEAEKAFVRMDRLRNCRSSEGQLTSDLENLIQSQLDVKHYADANNSVQRLRAFKASAELDVLHKQTAGKANVIVKGQDCATCGKISINLMICSACRTVHYCSKNCQTLGWKVHKAACRSAANHSKSQGEKTVPVTNYPPRTDDLSVAVQANAATSHTVSPDRPSVLSEPLRTVLRDPAQTYFFRVADICSSRLLAQTQTQTACNASATGGGRHQGPRRFLATIGVLTCISVFAWAPSTSTDPTNALGVGVAAHIDLAAVVRGVRQCLITGQDFNRALYPLTNELRLSFRGVDPRTIRISLVGGHRVVDRNVALEGYLKSKKTGKLFNSDLPLSNYERDERDKSKGVVNIDDDPRVFFSWYARAACEAAGLAKAQYDTTLLNVFEGERCVDMETEMRNRRANMRFEIAALDTCTGHVITQTRYGEQEHDMLHTLIPPQEYRRQRDRYDELSFTGHSLYVVSHGS